MNDKDIRYVVKCRQCGISFEQIAAKLGVSSEEAKRAFDQAMFAAVASMISGCDAFICQFTILAHQYQLLGESLKTIGEALSAKVTIEDIKRLIDPTNLDKSARDILASFIILAPFNPAKTLPGHIPSSN